MHMHKYILKYAIRWNDYFLYKILKYIFIDNNWNDFLFVLNKLICYIFKYTNIIYVVYKFGKTLICILLCIFVNVFHEYA